MSIARRAAPALGRWLFFLPALWCLSCGGGGGTSLNPVQGKVLYKDQPAQGAMVTFHPVNDNGVNTIRPTGAVGRDGTFTLTTGKDKGAPAGDYVVTIIWMENIEPKGGKKKALTMAPPETRDKLGGAYGSVDNNRNRPEFKVTVKSGANQLEPFVLK